MLNWVKDKFGKNNESAEQIAFARDEYLKDYVSELPVSQPLICAHEIASVGTARRIEVDHAIAELAH